MPLFGIDGFIRFGKRIAGRPFAGTLDILPVGEGRVDFERGVVLPLVGVADFYAESGEFLAGAHLGRVAHPVELVDVLAEGRAEILHQGHHAGLVLGGEELLDVHFAYGLAQGAVGNGHGTFPAGTGLLLARHRAAVEVERCGVEVIVQVGCCGVEVLRCQVVAQVFDRSGFD